MNRDPKIQAHLRAIVIYNAGLLSRNAATTQDFDVFMDFHFEVISDLSTASHALDGGLTDDELVQFLEKYRSKPLLTDALKAHFGVC